MSRDGPDVGGQQCPVLFSFLSGFPENRVRCLSRPRVPDVCPMSVRILFCLDPVRCPDSVCPAWQRRERAVRTFTVLVRRRLVKCPKLSEKIKSHLIQWNLCQKNQKQYAYAILKYPDKKPPKENISFLLPVTGFRLKDISFRRHSVCWRHSVCFQ